jgi:hypothetical protein
VFNGQPFYIILDVCEGGQFAPGTITSTQTMDVDYVRAYSLPAPSGVAAADATSTAPAQIIWNAVDGATSYEVWRNTSTSLTTAREVTNSATGTSYSDTSAKAETEYYYWVVAANAAQTSGFSVATATIQTPTVTIGSPPANIYYDGTSDVTSWATASVTGVSGSPAPTGSASLTYYNGTTATGTPLSSSPEGLGTYTVVANYAGDSNYFPAQSAPVTFTISNPAGLQTSAGAQYTITWIAGAPTLDVAEGTITLSADLSTALPNYSLTIENGALVLLDSSQHMAQLQLNGNGTLNIGSSSVIISYSGADPMTTIESYLVSGSNAGTWNGTGIVSTAAATSGGRYGIGSVDGADGVVSGLSAGQIEISYALYGDTNLDGLVSGDDYTAVVGNLGKQVMAWDKGDFVYTDLVNGDDFTRLVSNMGMQASLPQVTVSENNSILLSAAAPTSTVLKTVSVSVPPVATSHHITIAKARSDKHR